MSDWAPFVILPFGTVLALGLSALLLRRWNQ
jgi:hypothetical protein